MDRMKNEESYGDDRMRMIIPYAHTHTVCELPMYAATMSAHSCMLCADCETNRTYSLVDVRDISVRLR